MTTAGYSGTPLPKKLGIGAGHVVAAIEAPDDVDQILGQLPADATLRRDLRVAPDVIVAFFTDARTFERRLPKLASRIFPAAALWIAWPKRASKVPTDMTEDVVRLHGLPLGVVDNKVCAIDEVWSGLRLVWRKELRGGDCPI